MLIPPLEKKSRALLARMLTGLCTLLFLNLEEKLKYHPIRDQWIKNLLKD